MTSAKSGLNRRQILAGLVSVPAVSGLLAGLGMPQMAMASGKTVVTMLAETEAASMLSFVDSSSIIFTARTTEGLLEYAQDMTPQPLLATAWEIAEDGLTYTFQLRQGVKWHDGQPFTAKDVKYSIETSAKYHPRNRSTLSKIVAVETPDDFTVVLRLSSPTPFLIKAFGSIETPIVPAHIYAGAETPLNHPNQIAPIGTGPYKFKEWVRGSHVIWEKNPEYWNPGLPIVDTLIAKFVLDAAARTIAFETGAADIGYRTPVPFRDLERLKDTGQIEFTTDGYAYDPPNIIIVEANLRDPILSDLRVRQAIAHCLDREMINRVVFFKYATPSASPVVPNQGEFHLSEPSPYPFDLERAKTLMAEAGYKDGIDLTIDFVGDTQRLLAEYLRGTLSKAGIRLTLRGQDMGTLIARVYGEQAYQLHLASISNLFDPQVGVQRLFWSKNIIKGVAFSNGTSYSDPEVDAWIEEAAVSLDHARRVELWHMIQRKVMTDVPSFPIVQAAWQTISNKRIADHTTNGEGFEGSMARVRIAG